MHRVANIYFIFILILNFVPNVQAFAKELAILPVVIVLAFTAVKDGFEDLKRFRADKTVNNSVTSAFSIKDCCYKNRRLADICPGDFVKVRANEVMPADILLLQSSEISGMCHIETANLDGETNLKQRECVRLSQLQTFSPVEFSWPVEVEAPNAELYHFTGKVLTPTPAIVRKDNLLLRGCVLRNTDSVEGMVIYAGRETKASLNNSSYKFKRSKLEGRLNRDIIWCIPILIGVCLFASIGTYVWLNNFWGANGLFLQSEESANPALSAFINFWVFVIIFQAMIPLPLYVAIEGVKVLQVFFIEHDLGLYDAKRDQTADVHAFNIPEDLGQIEYVFCDKTGTLTENKMIFKRAVINGVDYHVDQALSDKSVEVLDEKAPQDATVPPDRLLSAVRQFISFVPPSSRPNAKTSFGQMTSHSSPNLTRLPLLTKKHRSPGLVDIMGDMSEQRNCQRIQDFFLCLTVCNTCVVSTNKQMSTPFTPVPKRRLFRHLRRGMKSSTDEYSSRFRRLFIRRSRGEIFEVDEGDTEKSSSTFGDEKSIDPKLPKSWSISNLFTWRHQKSDAWTFETDTPDRHSFQPLKSVLSPHMESPQLGGDMEIKSTLSGRSSPNAWDDTCEPQPLSARQWLFQPKYKIVKRFNRQKRHYQHHSSVLTPDFNAGDLLNQASLSTPRRIVDFFSIDQPSSHICPLSEDVLINSYESESPDEVTLVKTACNYGCKLLQRSTDFVILWMPGDGLIRVEVLMLLPFVSNRKRMSIIIRHPDTDEVVLYCKGADSAILPLLDPRKEQAFRASTEESLKVYSHSGLRTLVMAKRVIPESTYQAWSAAWSAAEQDYQRSEELKEKLIDDIEVNLELLGATGIEDSLQEGVPETIEALHEAGLKVWVLTGDKQETAISIAYAAKLITAKQKLFVLSSPNLEATKQQLEGFLMALISCRSRTLSASSYLTSNTTSPVQESPPMKIRNSAIFSNVKVKEVQKESVPFSIFPTAPTINNESTADIPQEGSVLVVDSGCLAFVEEDEVQELFIKLARICSSVICCRFTPSQKAAVTHLVKKQLRVQIMAVGDGANDVSMIQCANVGVGIRGREGMQAAMASDFAITQFFFLKRLLLVHGHWCYEKLARMALYMFYKDAVYIFSLFWFQIFNGFSGKGHINQLSQVLFNVTFTSIPPFVLGAFDNVLDDQTLLANPKLYRNGRDSMTYKPWHFWLNTLDALWQSLVIFFIPYLIFNSTICSIDELGTTCMNALILTSLLHIALETRRFTIIHISTYAGSYFILWLVFNAIYSSVWAFHDSKDESYFVIFVLFLDARFWFCTVICPIAALLPRLLSSSTLNTFAPSLDILAGQLRTKHGCGVNLPIERYVEEHDARQPKNEVPHRRGLRLVQPQNVRSHIMQWFSAVGHLLQRMPTLKKHSQKPSLLAVRNFSFVWSSQSPTSEPVAYTLPRTDAVTFTSTVDTCYNSAVSSELMHP